MSILAQLWRVSYDGKLQNKLRSWTHSNEKSTIVPDEGIEGLIEFPDLKTVMTVTNGINNEVGFKPKLPTQNETQLWTLEHPDKKGWRRIYSSVNGLYLTSSYNGKYTVLTV